MLGATLSGGAKRSSYPPDRYPYPELFAAKDAAKAAKAAKAAAKSACLTKKAGVNSSGDSLYASLQLDEKDGKGVLTGPQRPGSTLYSVMARSGRGHSVERVTWI